MPKFITPDILAEATMQKFVDFVSKYLSSGQSVLEIGAGEGKLADILTNKYELTYQIFDLKDDRKFAKDLMFSVVDVSKENFNLSDKSVDVILTTQVIEHLENISHFLRECRRVLKDGGLLIFKFPNFSSFFQKIYFLKLGMPTRLGGVLSSGGHINFLTYPFLVKFMQPFYELLELKGDLAVDFIFLPRLAGLFGKSKLLSFPNCALPTWSYNIMAGFKKIR